MRGVAGEAEKGRSRPLLLGGERDPKPSQFYYSKRVLLDFRPQSDFSLVSFLGFGTPRKTQ